MLREQATSGRTAPGRRARERRREHVDNPLPSHRSWDETLQVISGSQLLIESAVEELRWVLGQVAPAYTPPT
jgi:hypothetical protein